MSLNNLESNINIKMDVLNVAQVPKGQLTTVNLILNGKLQDIVKKYSELVKLMENVDECMAKAEAKILHHGQKNSAAESLKLATKLDHMHEQLSVCQGAIMSLTQIDFDSPVVTHTTDDAQRNTSQLGASSQENNQSVGGSAVNVLKLQLESLQQQMLCMQEAHETHIGKRLKEVETKLELMNSKEEDRLNTFASKLHKSEAKQLLIDNLQIKVNDSVSVLITDVTKLKIDLAGVQDNVNKLNSHQVSGEIQYKDMKSNIETLLKLRDTLNRMNHNVSNRAELSDKIKRLEGEIENFQLLLARENQPQAAAEREIFTAEIHPNIVVMPGEIIKFGKISYNNWGCFDERENYFEAIMGGVYFFGLSLNLISTGVLTAVILLNRKPVTMCAAPDVKELKTINTSILLQLSAGDRVWVAADIQTSPTGVEISSECSHFFGFCLIKN